MRAPEPLYRIEWQLPLSIAGVLLAVVAAYSWVAWGEVERAALDAAGERMRDVARQLEALLARSVSQRVEEVRRLAADPALVASVADGRPPPAEIRSTLEQLLSSRSQIVLAISDARGSLLYEGRAPEGDALSIGRNFPEWFSGDSAAVSGFFSDAGTVWFEVAAPVRRSGRTVGYVVESRGLADSPQGARMLADLVGRDVTFLVGAPGGAWTDLSRIVEGPPPPAMEATLPVAYRVAERGWRLGVSTPIAGTPWQVWVEFSRNRVLSRARAFLRSMLPLGAFVVLLGAAGGWVVSRRVTSGLARLSAAAAAIAEGDDGHRVPVGKRGDELDALASAFNAMAERVALARRDLERRVEDRTAELEASEVQFEAIATTAREAIVTANADGVITYANPGTERIFGYPQDELLGKPLTILMPERYRSAHRRELSPHRDAPEPMVRDEILDVSGLRRDGSEFPAEMSVASWRQRDGELVFAGIIRDVTPRREAEDALERHAAEVQAVNEELEAFSYSVSHDLRAPLRGIHGFSQALLEDYGDRLDAEGRDYLERVCSAVDRMGQLIDDLLELSRATRRVIQRRTVNLSTLAREVAAELRAGDPGRPATLVVADDLTTNGDPRLLRLVLQNLLANAWKFSSGEAEARIEVGSTAAANGDCAFFVRDNGVGFDMTYADKLFGAFQRLHPPSEFPGTGVGLALVQRIVHRHGGRVWAEAAVGQGATFYFTLPGS